MRTRPASVFGGLVLMAVSSGVLGACSLGGGGGTTATTLTPMESTEWRTIPTTSTTLSQNSAAEGQPPGGSEDVYTIQSGDFPFKVAGIFGCTWDEIAAYNEIDPDPAKFPFPGTDLKIPATCAADATETATEESTATATSAAATTTTAAALPAGQASYTIEANDTLSGIAAKFDTTMDAIIELNGWDDGIDHVLIPGEDIRVPVAG